MRAEQLALPSGTTDWQGIFFQAIYSASHYRVTNSKTDTKRKFIITFIIVKRVFFTSAALLLNTLSTLKVLPARGCSSPRWRRLWCRSSERSSRSAQLPETTLEKNHCALRTLLYLWFEGWQVFLRPDLRWYMENGKWSAPGDFSLVVLTPSEGRELWALRWDAELTGQSSAASASVTGTLEEGSRARGVQDRQIYAKGSTLGA